MYDLLGGIRVVEAASFVAGPLCGLYLLQLGAEVIRLDPIGGGPDRHRWPLAPTGESLYWQGLNKGKKSVAIDLSRPEGRELAAELITAPGPNTGLFVTNYPPDGFLSHARLASRRADLISVRVMGWNDGQTAVDYTVNAAVGVPYMTGPSSLGDLPVNHVLPAWDLTTGAYAAFALLAAERRRRDGGIGQEVRIPLSDMAIATLANLGNVAEVLAGEDRPRMGNDLFGAFGRDFATSDGHRLMIVAITSRQWSGLLAVLGLEAQVGALEMEIGASFKHDEGLRFRHRDRLFPLVEAAVSRRTASELSSAFDGAGVCWAPYRTLKEAITEDGRLCTENPIFSTIAHQGSLRYPTPGAAASFMGAERIGPGGAPHLGEHTDEILANVLGLSSGQIGGLHDKGIVAGAEVALPRAS
ncbi:CoA transferase [Aquabacter sp. CN5-332]|uniref:CoA transferase n=1 Tax=Aquabacter sp. CN5-332 TaxID=3156608 RepID=UPI0032B469FA